jgi:tubulin monoglycylase TTLL3/8
LEELKKKYPQFSLNGDKNIWIIKPAGSSRGRGIVLYKQLVEILDLCKSKESQFIAQKYIENTMIVKNRKFDIRQWVLVSDWNPLTVWLY